MKKVTCIAALVFAVMSSNAQTGFGFQVGGNLANVESEYTSGGATVKDDNKSKFGFLIGAVAEIPLTTSIYFRPELNFIQKGAKLSQNSTETSGGATFTSVATGEQTLNFIELPLNFVYMAPAGAGHFFIGAGPSIGFGISGKYEFDVTSTTSIPGFPPQTSTSTGKGDVKFDGTKEEDVAAGDENFHLKSLDFGANVLAGYKLSNGLSLNVGYTMGFSDLDPNDNSSFKTKGLTIKLGYIFGGAASGE
jgi:hypothetical protein